MESTHRFFLSAIITPIIVTSFTKVVTQFQNDRVDPAKNRRSYAKLHVLGIRSKDSKCSREIIPT